MSKVVLVTGAPCSGKTTYVREHMAPGDVVIDYDALAQALGSPDSHDHPEALLPFVYEVRDALVRRLARHYGPGTAWLIKCEPIQADYALSPEIVTVSATRAECHQRATEAGRPDRWHGYIDQWFDGRNLP